MVAPKKSRTWKSAAARRLLVLAGDPPTIDEAIKIVVSNTLEGVPHPPLALEALFRKLNISGVRVEDLPFSGELRPENGSYTIVCSQHLSPARRRFTIAHEMAHAILELSGPNCPRSGRELERLCDMMATELLMPRAIFVAHAGKDPNIDNVLELARTFQTSITSTAIRCAELFKLSVFEVEDGSVLWGYGAIKKGSTRLLDSDLQRVIGEAQTTRRGSAVLHLRVRGSVRAWDVQYQGTKKNRTLFLLQPYFGGQTRHARIGPW
jgi:hypothetical protein